MTLTLPQQTWKTVIQEPIALALAQPHQVLLSTGSVAIMAQFAAHGGIVHPAIGYLIAGGVEWAYLRGLAYNQRVSNRWGTALIWVAFVIMLLWGVLWAAYIYGAYSLQPQGSAAWWLAIAHIAPIAAISFCSAMSHQVATRYEQEQAFKQEQWRQELERRHEAQMQQLKIEQERLRLEDEQKYRAMRLQEEQRALRASIRASASASKHPSARARTSKRASLAGIEARNGAEDSASPGASAHPLDCPHCGARLNNAGEKGRATRYGHCSHCRQKASED